MLKWLGLICLLLTAPLTAETQVLALSGSLREDSVNKKLVLEAANIARQMGASVQVINLKNYDIPFYDGDLESSQGMPEGAKKLREMMKNSQVILIASPEYNGSLSGVLKNALDWASRSEKGTPSRDAFAGKKFVIMSASPGGGGGIRGLAHLKAVIENVGGQVIDTQVTVPNAYSAFDSSGSLQVPAAKAQLQQAIRQALNQ